MSEEKAAALYSAGKYAACLALLEECPPSPDNAYNAALAAFRIDGDAALFTERAELADAADAEVRLGSAARWYGRACMLCRARKYAAALLILDKLLPLVEQLPRDDPDLAELARRIVLLTVRVHICRGAPQEALQLADAESAVMQGASERTADVRARLRARAELALGRIPTETAERNGSPAWDMLNAHGAFLKGDHISAGARLSAIDVAGAPAEVEMCRDANLALCRAAAGKTWAAVCRTQRAFRNRPTADAGSRRRLPLAANLGLLLLKASRPERAFECLVETANGRPGDPRSWLRLAECCLAASPPAETEGPAFVEIGSGPHAKLVPTGALAESSTADESCAVPAPSPEFASLCLVNANVSLSSFGDADPAKARSLRETRALLACRAAVRLGDPAAAIREAETVLKGDGRSGRRALAALYLAEARALAGRADEAALSFKNCLRIAAEADSPARDAILSAAKVGMLACAAVAGDAALAKELLKQTTAALAAVPASLPLRLYLAVKSGTYDLAAALLRDRGRVQPPK